MVSTPWGTLILWFRRDSQKKTLFIVDTNRSKSNQHKQFMQNMCEKQFHRCAQQFLPIHFIQIFEYNKQVLKSKCGVGNLYKVITLFHNLKICCRDSQCGGGMFGISSPSLENWRITSTVELNLIPNTDHPQNMISMKYKQNISFEKLHVNSSDSRQGPMFPSLLGVRALHFDRL